MAPLQTASPPAAPPLQCLLLVGFVAAPLAKPHLKGCLMSLRTRLATLVSMAALPLFLGCAYEEEHHHHDGVYGHPAGYYERHDDWRRDRDWDQDRHDWDDHDHDRRWDR